MQPDTSQLAAGSFIKIKMIRGQLVFTGGVRVRGAHMREGRWWSGGGFRELKPFLRWGLSAFVPTKPRNDS